VEWYFILIIVVAVAIVLFVPLLVWAAVVSGLYQVIRDRRRRRVTATRRKRVAREAEEIVTPEVT
jgi:hypothetical protein